MMVSNAVLIGIGIAIGVAVGIGIGFGAFAGNSVNLANEVEEQKAKITILESELEEADKKIDSLQMSQQQNMQKMLQMIMEDPVMMEQMIDMMMQNPQFMEMMESMGHDSMEGQMGESMMSSMIQQQIMLNPEVPITIPMIDGYYNDKKVFFIHTEVSDRGMAEMMTKMINFPTLHVSKLTSEEDTAKVYVFTNGIPGSGRYGGGPFMFQIDIFDSVPGEEGYSQFRVPYLVTWNDDAKPRILTSEKDLLQAEANGELTIQKTDNVVNAPIIVWTGDNGEKVASKIERIFESMPDFKAEVINVNVDNYIVTLKLVKSG